MNLYMVKYKQWNSCFSENYERERLSVGNNKYEAIPKVKETVSKDAREFAAEKISAVFGYEVKISGDGAQMCSTHFKELKQRICELEEEFQQFKPFKGFEHAMYRKLCETKIAIEKLPAVPRNKRR